MADRKFTACPFCKARALSIVALLDEKAALKAERDEWKENAEVHNAENAQLMDERDALRADMNSIAVKLGLAVHEIDDISADLYSIRHVAVFGINRGHEDGD